MVDCFDEASKARASLEQVKNVHRRIHGIISPAESVPLETPYDALDVKLLPWVHATLIDSAMMAYDIFVKPFAANEKSKYYDDSKKLACLFEIPEMLVPASLADFDRYMNRMLSGNEISVGSTARALAKEILRPRPWVLKPTAPLFRLVTAGCFRNGCARPMGSAGINVKRRCFGHSPKESGVCFRLFPDRCASFPTLAPWKSAGKFRHLKRQFFWPNYYGSFDAFYLGSPVLSGTPSIRFRH